MNNCEKKKDVLVGSLGSQEQLEINLRDNFYYVPAKYVKEADLPIRFVAIYQSIKTEEPGITYYAEVQSTELVKRSTIPVKIRHNNGNDDYYLFKVRAWQKLATQIEVKPDTTDDIVLEPRFTTYYLLKNSNSIEDLF